MVNWFIIVISDEIWFQWPYLWWCFMPFKWYSQCQTDTWVQHSLAQLNSTQLNQTQLNWVWAQVHSWHIKCEYHQCYAMKIHILIQANLVHYLFNIFSNDHFKLWKITINLNHYFIFEISFHLKLIVKFTMEIFKQH